MVCHQACSPKSALVCAAHMKHPHHCCYIIASLYIVLLGSHQCIRARAHSAYLSNVRHAITTQGGLRLWR